MDVVDTLLKLQAAREAKEKADRDLAKAQKDWDDKIGPPPLPIIKRRI